MSESDILITIAIFYILGINVLGYIFFGKKGPLG